MKTRAMYAARALTLLTALLDPASAVPFRRFSNYTIAPYANTSSHGSSSQTTSNILITGSSSQTTSNILITGSSEPTTYTSSGSTAAESSPSTESTLAEPSSSLASPTDLATSSCSPEPLVVSTVDDQPPSTYSPLSSSTTSDDFTYIWSPVAPVPVTSVVFVTQTEQEPKGQAPASETSVVVVTQTVDETEFVPQQVTRTAVLLTSVRTVKPASFLVLLTSTQTLTETVTYPQPSATMTTTLQPKSSPTGSPVTSVPISTQLETKGAVTSRPFATQNTVTSSVSPSALSKTASVQPLGLSNSTGVVDPFKAIATGAPAKQITATGNHPVPTTNILPQKDPLHTNKFYANLYLGDQMSSVFTHPYSLSWANGSGATKSFGFAIQHIEAQQRAFGPVNSSLPGSPASYFINPLGLQNIVISAKELGQGTKLTSDTLDTFSANANLLPTTGSSSSIKFPLVQGMGFVTAIYTSLQPQIQSGIFFSKAAALGDIGNNVYKWRLSLNDGTTWLLYVSPASSTSGSPNFTLVNNGLLEGPANFNGVVQIAKNPPNATSEAVYDKAAGIYPTSAAITGAVNGKIGQYRLSWTVGGKNTSSRAIVQYALPHHLESFDNATYAQVVKDMKLQTTTKGVATAVVANSWTLVESNLPNDMGFAPWSPNTGTLKTYTSTAVNAMYKAAQVELQQNMSSQTNTDSMYFSGKALSKFASIVYAVNNLCNEPGLAQQGLKQLQQSFNLFTANQQQHPLVYDTVWKGVVSSASYNGGNALADFGNTYYNDHHFHYGYFLHAAAVIGSLDANWLAANRDWVNSLARDVNNPSHADPYFPVFRNFDWYHGHSWAKGLFESGDSKDEESSSEDVMFSYGLKMWGAVSGDAAMEARGNLQLALTARSLHNYFLMEDDNVNQPAQFIGNRASGILFENKVDHTTYFGTNLEYIEGIHMLPLIPASALTRRQQFVQQEWNAFFKTGAVDDAANVQGGWKGVLYANLALIDPRSSFAFFNQDNFDSSWLDGGASRTWYLAMAAGLGGA